MNKQSIGAKISLIVSMFIFGTIGIFRNYIYLPSGEAFPSGALAFVRAAVGTLFLLILYIFKKEKTPVAAYKSKLPILFITGAIIGFNWILLFEALRTSVVVGTLCYYMAPVIVIAVSPVLFKEKLTPGKLLCIAVSLVGVVLVSGIIGNSSVSFSCVLFGLGAAVLYACAICLNKITSSVPTYEKTMIQLFSAAVVVLPYSLLTEEVSFSGHAFSEIAPSLILLLILGIVHTGAAYALYFSSLSKIPAQTVALYSYIDPVVAIILSGLILREPIGVFEIVGSCLILGSTFLCEIFFSGEKK